MGKNIILVFAKLKSPFSTHNYMCFLKISLEVFGVQMMPTMASRDLLCARILCFVFIVQVHVPVSSCDVMDIVACSLHFSSGTLHAYSESHDPS